MDLIWHNPKIVASDDGLLKIHSQKNVRTYESAVEYFVKYRQSCHSASVALLCGTNERLRMTLSLAYPSLSRKMSPLPPNASPNITGSSFLSLSSASKSSNRTTHHSPLSTAKGTTDNKSQTLHTLNIHLPRSTSPACSTVALGPPRFHATQRWRCKCSSE